MTVPMAKTPGNSPAKPPAAVSERNAPNSKWPVIRPVPCTANISDCALAFKSPWARLFKYTCPTTKNPVITGPFNANANVTNPVDPPMVKSAKITHQIDSPITMLPRTPKRVRNAGSNARQVTSLA